MIRFLCPPRSGCSLAAGWLRLHGAVALFSAEQACKLCVEYTLKQEAPCFQPLVVHGRACRSVPDGAGGPLRALPCPPMFGSTFAKRNGAGAVLASLSRKKSFSFRRYTEAESPSA